MIMSSPWRFAIAGPSGSGKTTLARRLNARYPESRCIHEPELPLNILLANQLSSKIAYDFQAAITGSRKLQALSAAPELIIFDRTFEEDREIFLNLYRQLGYLNELQADELSRISVSAERDVGSPHAGILLTAKPAVLRRRVLSDPEQRPRWLIKHLDLQYAHYAHWQATVTGRFAIHDTSDVDPSSLVDVVAGYIELMLRSVRPPEGPTR
jgi:deoxyadenosine/deoxycytidine kinase